MSRWATRRRLTWGSKDGPRRHPLAAFRIVRVQRAETYFELRYGAGLKILFGKVWTCVDAIDHVVLDHFLSGKSEHDIQVTAGLLVAF